MAHNCSNFPHSHDQEYHPLDSLQHPYHSSARAGPPSTSKNFGNDVTSYLGLELTDYGDSVNVRNPGGAETKAPYSSTQNSYTTELLPKPLSARSDFSMRDWQWEFGASLLSLGCFAAVVGILAAYDTKSLATWNFVLDISLNTLIAILSTLSRTALMVPVASGISQLKWIHLVSASRPLRDVQVFEDASRGPWGSLELIWRLHIKSKLATWGSAITILTLAMGPFAQQLISYPSRSVVTGTATFYTSHIYDSVWGETRGLRGASGDIKVTTGPKMQGAILGGLFNISSPVQFGCPTGTCKWDKFSSLAVTSTCQNVTSTSKILCDQQGGFTSCNYTLPSGMLIKGVVSRSSGGGYWTRFNSTAFEPESYGQSWIWNRDEPINSTIARIGMADLQGDFNFSNPDLLECDMRLCARITRNMTVTNGTFYPGIFEDIELEGVPGKYETNIIPQGARAERDWYTFNITGDHPSYTGNQSFSYHYLDIENVKKYLYDIFTSDEDGPFYLPLMNSTDRAGTIASISQSMSYAFAHAPSREVFEGRSLSDELYIQVHWLWIILPLAEVIMSVTFLVCTLIHTQRQGVAVWKSSGIVPLLTAMVGWDNKELGVTSRTDIEKRSRHMRGQLVAEDGNVLQSFHRKD